MHDQSSRLCACGCGQVTPIYKRTRPKLGHVKGEHARFVSGHTAIGGPRLALPVAERRKADPVPCACGCGTMLVPFAEEGRPRRYVSGHNVERRPLLERLLAHSITEGECLVWTGTKDGSGYGQIGVGSKGKDRRIERVHRAAWTVRRGPIPEGMNVLHRCDNPPCWRDDHLFLGTKAENTADMVAKERDRFFGRPPLRGQERRR